MVAELKAQQEARSKFSRRRKHYQDGDIDSINDRNAHFNRKLERTYGKYTAEIKGNLERGSKFPLPWFSCRCFSVLTLPIPLPAAAL
jgi:hypothetical protein